MVCSETYFFASSGGRIIALPIPIIDAVCRVSQKEFCVGVCPGTGVCQKGKINPFACQRFIYKFSIAEKESRSTPWTPCTRPMRVRLRRHAPPPLHRSPHRTRRLVDTASATQCKESERSHHNTDPSPTPGSPLLNGPPETLSTRRRRRHVLPRASARNHPASSLTMSASVFGRWGVHVARPSSGSGPCTSPASCS